MTRNIVAITSAALFVALAALLALIPAPFVAWNPGQAYNVLAVNDGTPVIRVSGVQTYPPSGQLFMTTVSTTRVDASVSLPEALLAHWGGASDAMPREAIYPAGKSVEQVQREAVVQMDTSQQDATVAALRAAGQPVTEMVQITSVTASGPAFDKLKPGDLISKVEGAEITTREQVQAAVRQRKVGDTVNFEVIRGRTVLQVPVETASSNTDRSVASVGVGLGIGYRYDAQIEFGLDRSVVGSSAGMVFALGVYDTITEGDLIADRRVAGTGSISPSGQVGRIGGIREKIHGAQDAGATIFLVPAENCGDIGDFDTTLNLVKVTTLKDAIASLQLLSEANPSTEVPRCG